MTSSEGQAELTPPQALAVYSSVVEAPTDGGAGPALWYSTGRSPNLGSAGESFTLTEGGSLTAMTGDYFGNEDSAYGLYSFMTRLAVCQVAVGR